MAEYGDVRLSELEDFQSKILKLSNVLKQYHELVMYTMKMTGQNWRDSKFVEFEREFRRYQDEITTISEEYKTWARGYLQEEIDRVRDFVGTQVPTNM